MRFLRLPFLFFITLTSQFSGLAQQVFKPADSQPRIRFEHLTTADGLPNNSVTCILQDRLGFIWLGTQNGLVRYDGTQMTEFQDDPNNTYSLKGRIIGALYQDRKGDIWIGSENLIRFEYTTGRFIEYPPKASEDYSHDSFISFIHEDHQGDIWTINWRESDGRTRLNRFNPKTTTWTYFRHDPNDLHSLASNSVYLSSTNTINNFAFVEDKSGTIWVTTKGDSQNILHRFNPNTAQFSRFIPKTSSAIADDFRRVTVLAEDRQGQLYLSSFANGKGIFRLNPQTGQVTQFKHDPRNPNSPRCDSVTRVHQSQDGLVWIPTNQGLDRLNPKTGLFTHFIAKPNDPTSPSPGLLKFLYELPNGDIWFKATDGLNYYNHRRQQFVRYRESNEPDGLQAGGRVSSLLVDRTGLVWAGQFDGGLYKQNRAVKFSPLPLRSGSGRAVSSVIYSIYEAPSEPGIIWLGTGDGLERVDQQTGHHTTYRHENNNPNSIGQGIIWDIAEDKQGRLWIATEGGGLNRMDRKRGTFTHFMHDPTTANSLMNNYIRALLTASDSTLWLGTYQGLDHFDPNQHLFTHYYRADSLYRPELYTRIQSLMATRRPIGAIDYPGNQANKSVAFSLAQATTLLLIVGGEWTPVELSDYGWLEDENGKQRWATTYAQSAGDGLMGRVRNQIVVVHLPAGRYRLRYRSSDDYAYGQWSGGAPYHPELWGIRCFALTPTEGQAITHLARGRHFTGVASNSIPSLREDAQKRIWIGTALEGRLQVLHPTSGQFTNYLTNVRGLTSVQSILADTRPGCFWVGDVIAGLLLVDGQGRLLKRYTRTNGLPNNTVWAIQRDRKGYVWVATSNGLARLDPKTDHFRHFTQHDGLLDADVYAFGTDSHGKFYAGSTKGIVTFAPDQIQDNVFAPSVVLTELTINGKLATVGPGGQLSLAISMAKEITLPHDQNDLTFQFTAISYDRGSESQYAFKITPIDTAWVPLGATRQARFLDLRPGTYTFQIKAANADGVWNEKGTRVQITILPPWWRTWWAYLLYALAFGVLLRAYIVYRSRALVQANRVLEERMAQRTLEVEQQKGEIEQQKEEITAQRDHLEETLTELQTTQTQLIQKEKLASLGELTAGIAHEIQNPLNFVNNFSEVSAELAAELVDELDRVALDKGDVEEAKALASDLSSNLRKINHHGQRASSIVKGMLEHSRSESGEKRLTNLNALCDEYLKIAYHGLRAKDKTGFNCELVTDFDPELKPVEVTPQDMGRVLLNLYNNAFYAVAERKKQFDPDYKPTVEVRTKWESDQVEIRVSDNGIGIPDSVKAKIFQPFFTTKPTGEGTGLGLSLSYDIITKGHGGMLIMDSQQNQGTEFTISLPTKA